MDPVRVDAIERDRNRPNSELWSRLQRQLGELRKFLEELPAEAWTKQGEHPTLGAMDLPRIVDAFLVGHLEDHAIQLDGLAAHNS